tara:strand:- start:2620 stop:3108 length:489 start_codon:yes stop_codon:yes gene_type:complete
MIGEIAIAIKALDSAFVLCQSAISKKKEIDDMAGEVGKFFSAKKRVEDAMAKAESSGNEDLLVGSALEEAITIDQQKERMEKMMKKLGDYYSTKGQTHRWVKIKADAVRIQKKRDLKAKQKAKRSEEDELLIKQLGIIFISMIGAVAAIAGIVFLIFGIDTE